MLSYLAYKLRTVTEVSILISFISMSMVHRHGTMIHATNCGSPKV